jgi:DNA-binding MarR family transcriptional regulator
MKLLEITPKGKRALQNISKEKDEFLSRYLEDYSKSDC